MWEDEKVVLKLTLVLRVLINPRFQSQILEVWVLINNLHIWTKSKIFPVINIQHLSHYDIKFFNSFVMIIFTRYSPIHPIQSYSSYTILFILYYPIQIILSYSSYTILFILYYPIQPILFIPYNPIHPIQSYSSRTILLILSFLFYPILSYYFYLSYSNFLFLFYPI